MRSSEPIYFSSFHVTISNIAQKNTLGGRMKACTIVGCHSEYFWGYSISNFLFEKQLLCLLL